MSGKATLEIAQPKPTTVSPEEAEAAAQAAEMLHNLTLIEHMAGEARVLMCLRNEASAEADKAKSSELVVRPSASAAAKLLGANGRAAHPLKLADAEPAGGKSAHLRAAADQFDAKAKACLQNVFTNTQKLAKSLGYTLTMEPVKG